MNTLEVRLFGGLTVSVNGSPVGPFPTRWSGGLLAYLALNKGHSIHRDVLTAQFWPEDPDARARKGLRNALWRVRKTIEPREVPPGSFLMVTGRNVGLRRENVWIDVEAFDGRMALLRREEENSIRLADLEECVGLYRGHFMEGLDFPWCTFERERLRLGFLTTLEYLLDYHLGQGDWGRAIHTGRTILNHDPLRENVHRCLMVCHHLMGNRPLAIQQYRACAEVLDDELGLEPMQATKDLYRDILAETVRERLSEGGYASLTRLRRGGQRSALAGQGFHEDP
jgi:DNA-binding SARP family transcriptional activator